VRLDALPTVREAPRAPGLDFDPGALQPFDAQGLLRAAEIGMLPEGRLELMIRALSHRLGLPAGAWVGDAFVPELADIAAASWDHVARSAGAPFAPQQAGTGFLRRVRSVFSEDILGPDGPAPGARQALEMAIPARHTTWTASILPVCRDAAGNALIGVERRALPAAQLRFGDAALPCVPAWRVALLPDAADPLRAAAAEAMGCAADFLTRLGAAYHPSLGISPERVQPFVTHAAALPADKRAGLDFVALDELLSRAADLRDGHLLIAAFRLAGMIAAA
jgi:hypothetical protein